MKPRHDMNYYKVQATIETLLPSLGIDTETQDEYKDTPRRIANLYYDMLCPEAFEFTTFENTGTDQMIVTDAIDFHSMCSHHFLPFVGVAHIGYIPDERTAGLSKLARAVDYIAAGFWMQEELTTEITDFLTEELEPKGLAVVLQAEHQCMSLRGVKKPGHRTTTSSMNGVFMEKGNEARAEFFALIRR